MTAQVSGRTTSTSPPARPRHAGGLPLSETVVWGWLREYYARRGIEAWSTGAVPHFITVNAFIARSYAHVLHAHLGELAARDGLVAGEPVHVVELGSGHGRFAYLLLRHLADLLTLRPVPGLALRYVTTDVAERNLDFQARHPLLAPLLATGELDQALFDCESGTELELRHSGTRLEPGGTANPVVVIGNYLFDSLRQDAFRVRDGVLQEGLVTVGGHGRDPDRTDPAFLEELEFTYDHVPVGPGRYPDPARQRILADYTAELPNTSFLMPVGALDCLDRLHALSTGGLFLVAGDKGHNHIDQLCWQSDPEPVGHGSFSLSVNFHAVGEYVRHRGGWALHSTARDASLAVSAFVLPGAGADRHPADGHPANRHEDGHADRGWPATRQAFREHVEAFGPLDYFTVHAAMVRLADRLTLPEALAVLRMSGFDPTALRGLGDDLVTLAAGADDRGRVELCRAVARCWDNYYPLGEPGDLPFLIGRLHGELGDHREALRFYGYSLDLHGEDRATHHNIGLMRYKLGEVVAAQEAFDRALALDPTNSVSRAWRLRLRAELAARTAGSTVSP